MRTIQERARAAAEKLLEPITCRCELNVEEIIAAEFEGANGCLGCITMVENVERERDEARAAVLSLKAYAAGLKHRKNKAEAEVERLKTTIKALDAEARMSKLCDPIATAIMGSAEKQDRASIVREAVVRALREVAGRIPLPQDGGGTTLYEFGRDTRDWLRGGADEIEREGGEK